MSQPERRERQTPGTGIGGYSPSKHQRKIMRKLQVRVDGFERLKTDRGWTRPGSQNLDK
jgi:hypothetical protein